MFKFENNGQRLRLYEMLRHAAPAPFIKNALPVLHGRDARIHPYMTKLEAEREAGYFLLCGRVSGVGRLAWESSDSVAQEEATSLGKGRSQALERGNAVHPRPKVVAHQVSRQEVLVSKLVAVC
jgi:hypothetical protein